MAPAMQIEALAWASASITSTDLFSAARASAKATTMVVLPTPPFMFATAITFPVTGTLPTRLGTTYFAFLVTALIPEIPLRQPAAWVSAQDRALSRSFPCTPDRASGSAQFRARRNVFRFRRGALRPWNLPADAKRDGQNG